MDLFNLILEYGSESRWVGHYYATNQLDTIKASETKAKKILAKILGALCEKCFRTEERDFCSRCLKKHKAPRNPGCHIPDITYEEAEKLWRKTDYAFGVGCVKDGSPINDADATAFFLEGYLYAQKSVASGSPASDA